MIAKWRTCVGDSQIGITLLTDLSKAFHFINHGIPIAKLAT